MNFTITVGPDSIPVDLTLSQRPSIVGLPSKGGAPVPYTPAPGLTAADVEACMASGDMGNPVIVPQDQGLGEVQLVRASDGATIATSDVFALA